MLKLFIWKILTLGFYPKYYKVKIGFKNGKVITLRVNQFNTEVTEGKITKMWWTAVSAVPMFIDPEEVIFVIELK